MNNKTRNLHKKEFFWKKSSFITKDVELMVCDIVFKIGIILVVIL